MENAAYGVEISKETVMHEIEDLEKVYISGDVASWIISISFLCNIENYNEINVF